MTEKNVVFIFSGDNDDLESSVNESRQAIDGLKDSTKKTSKGIEDGFAKAKKATDSLKGSTRDAAKQTAQLKTNVSEAQEALGALGAAVSVVNPELGMMIQQSSALVGGIKGLITAANLLAGVMGASLATVAAALVAIGAAVVVAGKAIKASWTEATQASRTLKASIERAQKALDPKRVEEAAKAWDSMKDVLDDLEVAYRLAEGSLDLFDLAAIKAVETIREQGRAELFLLGVKAQKLKIEQLELENLRALGGLNQKEEEQAITRIAQLREEFDLALKVKDAAEEQLQVMAVEANARVNQIRALHEAAQARRDGIEARKEEDDAAAEAADKELRRLESLGAAMDGIRAMQAAATQATLQDIALVESQRDDALAALGARFEEGRALTEGDSEERITLVQEFLEAKKAIEDEFDALRMEREKELADARADLRQQEIDDSITAAQTVADAVGSISDDALAAQTADLEALRDFRAENNENMTKAEKKQINQRIKEQKKALRKVVIAQKAAALIDVAIKTAQGIMAVWAQFGAFPPVAAALSAIVGAAGISSGIAVASQAVEFHRGGIVDAKLLDGEAVLNRQAVAALGQERINQMNNQQETAPTQTVLQIGRREAREIIRTDVRSQGLITQEIGRIANTFGNVGLSGLPVLA